VPDQRPREYDDIIKDEIEEETEPKKALFGLQDLLKIRK
jgi:hypothetical protein